MYIRRTILIPLVSDASGSRSLLSEKKTPQTFQKFILRTSYTVTKANITCVKPKKHIYIADQKLHPVYLCTYISVPCSCGKKQTQSVYYSMVSVI